MIDSGGATTAVGFQALKVATGADNTAVGNQAGSVATTAAALSLFGYTTGNDITTGGYNTLIGFNTGRGITTGEKNTIVGASVTGLSAALSNNVILADGDGNIRAQADSSGNWNIGGTFGAGVAASTAAWIKIAAGTTAKAQMNLPTSSAPTSPVDGDVWREDNTNTGLKIRINGTTKTVTVS